MVSLEEYYDALAERIDNIQFKSGSIPLDGGVKKFKVSSTETPGSVASENIAGERIYLEDILGDAYKPSPEIQKATVRTTIGSAASSAMGSGTPILIKAGGLGLGLLVAGTVLNWSLEQEYHKGNLPDNIKADLKSLGEDISEVGDSFSNYLKTKFKNDTENQLDTDISNSLSKAKNVDGVVINISQYTKDRLAILNKWIAGGLLRYGYKSYEGANIDLNTTDGTTFINRLNQLYNGYNVTVGSNQLARLTNGNYPKYIQSFVISGVKKFMTVLIVTPVPIASYDFDLIQEPVANGSDEKWTSGIYLYLKDANGNYIGGSGSSFTYQYRMYYDNDRSHNRLYSTTPDGSTINFGSMSSSEEHNGHPAWKIYCYPEKTLGEWETISVENRQGQLVPISRSRLVTFPLGEQFTETQTNNANIDETTIPVWSSSVYSKFGGNEFFVDWQLKNNSSTNSKLKKISIIPNAQTPISNGTSNAIGFGSTPQSALQNNGGLSFSGNPSNIADLICSNDASTPEGTPESNLNDILRNNTNKIGSTLIDTQTATEITPDDQTQPRPLEEVIQDTDDDAQKRYPDTNPPPVYIPNVVNDNDMFHLYKIDNQNLHELATFLWANIGSLESLSKLFSNPIDNIISLALYPFNPEAGSLTNIKIGNTATPSEGYPISQIVQEYDCGSVYIPTKYGYPTFLDYSPYTRVTLYLPFIGMVDLNTDDVMGGSISIKYKIELLSGSCLAQLRVSNGSSNAIYYQFAGSCSMQLPVTGSNYAQIYSGIIGSTASVASAIATGGATAPLAIGSLANLATNSKVNYQRAGSMQGNSGFLGSRTPYVIIQRPIALGYDKDFLKLTGQASCITTTIGALTGYAEIENIQLSHISNATKNELEELENILKSGIYV